MTGMGRWLLVVGLCVAALGALLLLGERFAWLRLGRLPGDIRIERDGFRLYVPLGTSLLLSALLSLVLWFVARRR